MAKVVDYFDDHVDFADGPFVVCSFCGRYRIGCQVSNESTPWLPHYSICMWREAFTDLGIGWVSDLDKVSRAVEELNRMAIVGDVIKSENGVWYIPACL